MSKNLVFISVLFQVLLAQAQGNQKVGNTDLAPIIFRSDNSENIFLGLFNNFFAVSPKNNLILELDSGFIQTEIDYEIGLARFQRFNLSHNQRLSEESQFYIDLRRRTYDGNFDNSVYENNLVRGGYSYVNDTSWTVDLRLLYSGLSKGLNWGMSDDTLIQNPQFNRELVPVINESSSFASSISRIQGGVLYGKALKLGLGFDIQRRDYLFIDSDVDTGLYDTTFLSSVETKDLMKEGYEKIYGQLKTSGKLDIVFKTGVLRRYNENFGLEAKNMPFSSLELSKSQRLSFGFTTVYGEGVFVNSYFMYRLRDVKKMTSVFDLRMTHGNNSPFYTDYSSNHYYWEKDRVSNTVIKLSLNTIDSLERFGGSINIDAQNNAMLWQEEMNEFTPLKKLQSILHAKVWMKKNIGSKWKLKLNYGIHPVIAGDFYKYPLHTVKSSISKTGSLFKSKLKYQLELQPEYYSRFEQYLLNPILFTPYASETSTALPGYLYTNLKATAWLGEVELFVKVWHINQGLTPYNYFDFPNYWGKDRFISFGVKKIFTD